jgi:deleted in liver cancer protein
MNDLKNKNVFGVPFKINVQRHGQPLPESIIQIMKYLLKHSQNTVGIFRKNGSKNRMSIIREAIEKSTIFYPEVELQKLKKLNESSDDIETDSPATITDENMLIDLADILKQYFRELPECLFTNKLSQTLVDIFICRFSLI